MTNNKSIVFFGNERIATGISNTDLPTLNNLLNNGYTIDAIFSPNKEASASGSISKNKRGFEVEEFAKNHNIPFYSNYSQEELLEILGGLPAQVGVLVAYGKIVPQSVIEHFEHGIINIHPSLLPKYRGSTPIESAILDGAKMTGVSLMQLVSEMDAGPVFIQHEVELSGSERKEQLAHDLNLLGAKMLVENLELIIDGKLKPKHQHGDITICKKISKTDGVINTERPADQVSREIRAFSGWPKSHLHYKGLDMIILEARTSVAKIAEGTLGAVEGTLILGCKNSSLEVLKLQAIGKKPMDAKSFINGYKNILS